MAFFSDETKKRYFAEWQIIASKFQRFIRVQEVLKGFCMVLERPGGFWRAPEGSEGSIRGFSAFYKSKSSMKHLNSSRAVQIKGSRLPNHLQDLYVIDLLHS